MKINRIDKLTELEYEETCIDEIPPHWDKRMIATHRLSWVDALTVVDAVLIRRTIFCGSNAAVTNLATSSSYESLQTVPIVCHVENRGLYTTLRLFRL